MTSIDTSTEAVERLLDGVTPGPWTEHDAGKHPHVFVCGPDELYYNGEVKDKPLVAYVTGVGAIENRAFIAAARDLVPALLKERDEARARVAPSLRITGPNSDGEYWLHIKAGGRSGGVNLGGEHGPICTRLLDAASKTGAKE